jgi:hypothetical protein
MPSGAREPFEDELVQRIRLTGLCATFDVEWRRLRFDPVDLPSVKHPRSLRNETRESYVDTDHIVI